VRGQAICPLLRVCSSDRASSGVDSASVKLPRNCRRISPSARQTASASRTKVYQRSRSRCDQEFFVVRRRRTQCQRDRGNRSILRISGRSSIYADISGHKVSPCTDISLSSEIVRLAIFRDNERNPPSCAVSASCDFPESQV